MLQKRNQEFERGFCADVPHFLGGGVKWQNAWYHTAACPARALVRASPPSKRSPRDPQRRGDMWAPLGRQTPRRRHLAAVKLVKLREQRAAVQPRRFERARSRASAARPLCARPCSAAAAVLDDDLTLTSAAMPLRLTLAHCTSEWARIAAVTIPGIGRRYGTLCISAHRPARRPQHAI